MREDGEQLERRRHLPFDDVERSALRVGVERVDPGAHDQLALVGLAHVDMHGVGHHDAVQHRLEEHRDECLQGMALQG